MKGYDQQKKILILAVLGFFISIDLLIHHVEVNYGFQNLPSSCVINSFFDCDSVAKSQYAQIGNFPVAAIGMGYYFLLICFLLISGAIEAKTVANVLVFLSSVALFPTIAMATISVFLLQKLCINCSVGYVINVVLFLIAFFSKQRNYPLINAYQKALTVSLSFCRTAFSSTNQQRFLTRTVLFLLFTVITCSYFSESFIIQTYNNARIRTVKSNIPIIENIIKQWQREPIKQVSISEESDFFNKDFALGSDSAQVTIVEFSDYECPFCKQIGMILKTTVTQSSGQMRLVLKNYPLDQSCNNKMLRPGHNFACSLATAVRCAGDQGDDFFWKAYETVMKNRGSYEELLTNFSKILSLDEPRFSICIKDGAVMNKIKRDIEEGHALGLKATPTLYVNGRLLPRMSTENLQSVLSEIVRKAK